MNELKHLIRRLTIQYTAASIIIFLLVGVSGAVMYEGLSLPWSDAWRLAGILLTSVIIMIIADGAVLHHDLRPIQKLVDCPEACPEAWQGAYARMLRLPGLAFRRIIGPHWLAVSVPALGLCAWAVHADLLHLRLYHVTLALLASLLVDGMHALAEYFLTNDAVHDPLRWMVRQSAARGVPLSLGGVPLSSLRTKFRASTLFIGALPVCLFTLAAAGGLVTNQNVVSTRYIAWVAIILILGMIFSWLASTWLARTVERPVTDLLEWLASIQRGEYGVRADDIYTDEFARVVQGFNHLAAALSLRHEQNTQLLESIFATLAAALDARDPYTAGHSQRVAEYAVRIAERAGFDAASIRRIRQVGLVHDIGKIGVPDAILMKPGELTPEEYAIIQTHPAVGESILRRVQPADALAHLLPGVRSHHERYDGRGYPDGLAGEAIPLDGRILAVADAFDAMTSDRPYRRGMPVARALAILEAGAGVQWDPKFVRIFVDLVRSGLGPLAGFGHPPRLDETAAGQEPVDAEPLVRDPSTCGIAEPSARQPASPDKPETPHPPEVRA